MHTNTHIRGKNYLTILVLQQTINQLIEKTSDLVSLLLLMKRHLIH